jgi:hypothetical protein
VVAGFDGLGCVDEGPDGEGAAWVVLGIWC